MAILQVHNLCVAFKQAEGTFQAVKGISFSIDEGEILGLIGESGSGKSVASQSITSLIPQAHITGSCLLNFNNHTIDLLEISAEALRSVRKSGISYIFQEPMTALNPLIKCGEQIAEGLSNKSDKKQQLSSLLDKVELSNTEHILNSYPHELSGGQRQRVMIAMALAKRPRLLIADEPTTALDIAVQTEILQLLRKLAKEENLGILFITHDLLSLKGFADNIAVMYHGHIVELDKADTVLKSPLHPYTRALIESRATYKKRGFKLAEINDLLQEDQNGLSFLTPVAEKLVETPSTTEVLIEVKNLFKWHLKKYLFRSTKTEVLTDLDLKLYLGDSLGLIGESGSGKSTIAKILLRIWEQSKGEVLVKGVPIKSFESFEEKVQLVFQDPYSSLNPKHKIGNAIREVLRSKRKTGSHAEVSDLLEMVGLNASDSNKYPHEFSGGQRQRICIAKALAKDPEILVLDEAVSALDVSVQAKILNLLNDLKRKKRLTYLLISHDMNVVSYFCNRIMVIKHGEVQEYGMTEELIKTPRSPYTKSLLEHSIY